jgi:hypothetical protein
MKVEITKDEFWGYYKKWWGQADFSTTQDPLDFYKWLEEELFGKDARKLNGKESQAV